MSDVSVDGTETILLAEDEVDLRAITAEYLESRGYRVLQAADGPSALRIAEKYENMIDVLIADLVMPGFGGSKLAEILRVTRPGIRIILVSGYTEEVVRMGKPLPSATFLQKPFGLHVLARNIRSILDQTAA